MPLQSLYVKDISEVRYDILDSHPLEGVRSINSGSFTITCPGSSIYVSKNESTPYIKKGSNSLTINASELAEGSYLVFAARGGFGLDSSYSGEDYFTVDRTAPTLSISAQNAAGDSVNISSGATVNSFFTLTGTDPANASNGTRGSGIAAYYIQKPGESSFTKVSYSNPVSFGYGLVKGTYKFKVEDYAGNMSSVFTLNYQADCWTDTASLRQQPTITENTYHIQNEKHLAWISWNSNTNSETYLNKIINIEADLDMSACVWEPIGNKNKNKSFLGTIQGNNHVIYGIKTQGKFEYMAFIGAASGAKVYDLNFAGLNIYGTSYVAGLAATADGASEFKNCYLEGLINNYEYLSRWGYAMEGYTGGVCASVSGTTKLENVGFYGAIKSKSNGYDGMLIGYVSSGIVMKNCFAAGTLTTDAYGKGFVGYKPTSATLQGCVMNVSINSTQTKQYYGNESDFTTDIWFQEAKLCGGMPLLRQFYWLGSAYGQQTINLSGYTKIA